MSAATELRGRLARGESVVLAGVFDCLSALVAREAGHTDMFLSGFAASASVLGVPDFGYMTQTEMADAARRVCHAVPDSSVIVDGDTGYGNALNTIRTIQLYEDAGAAGIFLEDQVWPKRCGHMAGKQVVPREDWLAKLRAAVDVRDELFVVARTDARAAVDLDEACARAQAAAELGVDAIFVEAPESLEELEAIAAATPGCVRVANMIEGGRTPLRSPEELHELGFDLIVTPLTGILAAHRAMAEAYGVLRREGSLREHLELVAEFDDFTATVDLDRPLRAGAALHAAVTVLSHSQPANDVGLDLDALEEIQRRVLWLAVRMVDHANNDRPSGEVKVGGHQASSASIVGIMTSLWFGHLGPDDKVAVKPHASPVLHSLNYLIGALDGSYLTRLRELGGLQAYPSRTKDPDVHDFSLGSVGLGVVAPLFAAAARRYVDAHFGAPRERPPRFIALAGDAELDEGNVWEAIADPALQGLGNVMWVIDTNRQSLDRVVPDQKIKKLMNHFAAAGWHVVEAKYGSKLQAAFEKPGGDELRRHVDGMSNEQYQSLFGLTRPGAARAVPPGRRARRSLHSWTSTATTTSPPSCRTSPVTISPSSSRCYRRCDEVTDRPSVVFAYTVKGWGLPIAGDPLNHAALLPRGAIDDLRRSAGAHARIGVGPLRTRLRVAGSLCAAVGQLLQRPAPTARPVVNVPISVLGSSAPSKPVSSQETFGRLLLRLADEPDVGPRLVTTSPDVSVSTNLGGWINKVGVFHPDEQTRLPR